MSKYGFYDRLTELFPSQVNVDVCEVCNYECIHCPQSLFKRSDTFSGAFLAEDINKKLVDEVAKYGRGLTQQIRYCAAGEPLLHPKMLNLLEYATANSGTMVTLTTNGSLLNSDTMNNLLEMKLGLIDFSLDALNDETYRKIRRKGELSIVRENVLNMLLLKKTLGASTRIVVSFVEQELNMNETEGFNSFWKNAGVDYVVIRKCHSAGGFFNKNDCPNLQTKPCVYPWERIVLGANGKLNFCPASWLGKTTISTDYRNISIRDVWNGDEYAKLRQEHLTGEFTRFQVCGDCPDRQNIIWPENRTETYRGYGDMIEGFLDQGEKQ